MAKKAKKKSAVKTATTSKKTKKVAVSVKNLDKFAGVRKFRFGEAEAEVFFIPAWLAMLVAFAAGVETIKRG